MVCICEICKCTLFYNHNVYKYLLAKIHSLGWKIRKYLPSLVVLLFRNSTDFAQVNTPKISQNAPMAKISLCNKGSKFPKQISKLLKNQFYVLYILDKCLKVKVFKMLQHQTKVMYLILCRFCYFKHVSIIIYG